MPEIKTGRPATAKTQSRAAKRPAPAGKKAAAKRKPGTSHRGRNGNGPVTRTTELSEDVLKSLDAGAQSAIEAVRRFVDTVDDALPQNGRASAKREEITDSALEMAQRLVHTQADFLRKVVDSAGKALKADARQ